MLEVRVDDAPELGLELLVLLVRLRLGLGVGIGLEPSRHGVTVSALPTQSQGSSLPPQGERVGALPLEPSRHGVRVRASRRASLGEPPCASSASARQAQTWSMRSSAACPPSPVAKATAGSPRTTASSWCLR